MVTKFCRGISRSVETPSTGIRAKTSTVTETTSDNCMTHDGKVGGRSNPLCGASTHTSKVRGSKSAARSLNLPCTVLVTRPGDIAVTETSARKRLLLIIMI
jgi:hypothetical protein